MTIDPIIPVIIISSLSLFVSLGSLLVSIASAILSARKINLEIRKWKEDSESNKKIKRLEFMRDLFNGFTSHNWRFVEYWSFPGVFPPLSAMQSAIPNKNEENQELFGQRVVVLEHINILLRVFAHRDILHTEDIQGFSHWANDWYEGSKEAMRTILASGDTYPLDFIIWLRDVIFRRHGDDFIKLFGAELKSRLELFEHPNK